MDLTGIYDGLTTDEQMAFISMQSFLNGLEMEDLRSWAIWEHKGRLMATKIVENLLIGGNLDGPSNEMAGQAFGDSYLG